MNKGYIGFLKLRFSFLLFTFLPSCLLSHAQACREERCAAGVFSSVLRVGRAGVRVADGLLHLLQLGVRVRHRKKPDPPPA